LAINVYTEVWKNANPIPWKTLTINIGQKGGVKVRAMEVRANRMAPIIMNLFSGIFKRAFPTKSLKTTDARKKIPMRTPISISVDPNFER
jgi:hypothetical protein